MQIVSRGEPRKCLRALLLRQMAIYATWPSHGGHGGHDCLSKVCGCCEVPALQAATMLSCDHAWAEDSSVVASCH